MLQTEADRDLLLGLLALENDLVDRGDLLTAVSVRIAEKTRPLSQILLDRGDLDTEKLTLLESLVTQRMDGPGGGPRGAPAPPGGLSTIGDDTPPATEPATGADTAETTIGDPPDGDDPFRTRYDDGPGESAPGVGRAAPGVGRFQILRHHAKGGLGQVSVALDRELDRPVAVKEIQDRYADHPVSRCRFIEEAEITGKLEHPGIIPIYSLGHHADGRPYYAMRFIKGDSLRKAIQDFHGDEALKHDAGERSLRLRDLVRRFLDACNAIAYAHSRGVLHRDLKPDNIMLGPYGETLVVDWGLAKSLEKEASAADHAHADPADGPIRLSSLSGSRAETMAGSAMGTPAYASPEQVSGRVDLIGPATDVYGLGATLYHLLTGRPPVDGRDMAEILQRVQAGDFPPPRSVDPSIPAGLDAICRKAMATGQQDRYPSARAIVEDVKRWFADEPVSAHRETAAERLRRWLRKHPTATAVAAALVLAGLIGSGIVIRVVTRKNGQIARMADDAEHSLRVACVGIDTLLTEVADVDLADVPQMEPVRRRLLKKALAGFQKFLDHKEDTPVLRWVSGRARGRLGEILEMMGQYKEAERSFRLSVEILEPLAASIPDEPGFRGDLVQARLGLGDLYRKMNRFREAEAELKLAAEGCGPLAAAVPDPYRRMQADIDYQLGVLWVKTRGNPGAAKPGDPDGDRDGKDAYLRAVQIQRDLLKETRGQPDQRAKLGRTLNNLAKLLSATGESGEAERLLREAVALVKDAQSLPGPRWQYARALHNLGTLLLRPAASPDASSARAEEGLASLRKSRDILRNLNDEFPRLPQYRQELATIHLNLARIERASKRPAEARAEFARAIDLDRELAGDFPEIPDYRLDLARTTLELAGTPAPAPEQSEETEAHAPDAIKVLEGLADEYGSVADYRHELGRGYFQLARLRFEADRFAEARSAIEKAIECQKSALSSNAENTEYPKALRNNHFLASKILLKLGETAGAAELAEEMPRLTPDDLKTYHQAATLLVECAGSAKDGGEDYARRAVEVLKKAAAKGLIREPLELNMREYLPLKGREDFRRLVESLGPPKAG